MTRTKFHWVCNFLFLIAGIGMTGSTILHTVPFKKRFQIEDSSRLYLSGTSNVNKFTCDCEDRHEAQTLEAEFNGGYARFRNANVLLKSKNFNCHNRKIEADMQKALQADQYPYIKVSLVDTWQDVKCLHGGCKDWFDVQANVNITITSVTKTESIPAKAKQIGPNQFQLRGEKALQMSAFGVDPPEAMFGMIKVDDWIVFHFDLVVSAEEVQ